VAHRHRPGTDKTFPAIAQTQSFYRASNWIGAVENPDRLLLFGCRLEHVTQGRNERVDPATEVLQIDQQNIETVHHRHRRAANFAVETKDGNAMDRVAEVWRFDHVVLLITAEPVLRAESGGEFDIATPGETVQRVLKMTRH
jgi:hypothetical protein